MFSRLFFSISAILFISGYTWLNTIDSSDSYTYTGETPGTLTAIGDAGSPNVFTFERWHFANFEMPDGDPTQVKATIEIDVTSAICDWKDLQASVLKKKDYFFTRKFPTAQVNIDGASATEDGQYTTEALLTLKGIEKPVTLTFSISDEAPYTIEGEGVIMRRSFNFYGDGPKDEVPIAFTAVVAL